MDQLQSDIDALLAEAVALTEAPAAATGVATAPPPPAPSSRAAISRPALGPVREDPSRILRLEVPVIVRLAERTMPLSEILGLSTGAIIEFDKPSDSQLDLMINNKCIGLGSAVKVGENFGLRVTEVGSVVDRIHALGGR